MKITVSELSKTYDSPVLNDISFEISTNGVLGLLGENGAGKTTLMEIIATLIRPDKGRVQYGHLRVEQDMYAIRKQIGYLPQKFDFFPNVTVEEALDYVCQLKGIRQHSQRKREIEQKLEQVGLMEQRKKRFRALSGGMKQRLGIAQVMISDPKLLLVDEPTVGLDPQERISFRQLLTTLASDRIIILSTHIVEDIALTAQHVLVLHAGKVQYMGDIPAFIATVEGKVWLYRGTIVPDEIQRSTMIVSSQATADGVEIRYLADIPVPNSFPLEATLEHAYIYANRKKGHYE